MKNDIKTKTYAIAAAVTILLVLTGFMFNWYFNFLREQDLQRKLLELQSSISGAQLEYSYISEFGGSCDLLEEFRKISTKSLSDINKKLVTYKEYAIGDFEYRRLRTEQTILYVKRWMTVLNMKKQCKMNISTILYFWGLDSASQSQGYVLDSVTEEFKEKVLVVPMDYNFDLGIIKILSKQFNVTKTPTIIVNEKTKLEGLTAKKDIVDVMYK